MTESRPIRFHRWHPSLLGGVALSTMASMLVGGAVTSSVTAAQIFGAVTGLPTAALAVRGFRSCTLLIDEDGVTVRTLLRRRRWSLDQVLGATIETGYVGMYERSFLVIHLINGRVYECREINTSAAKSEPLVPIAEAVNRAVRERASPRAE